jgi:hypothetical protein
MRSLTFSKKEKRKEVTDSRLHVLKATSDVGVYECDKEVWVLILIL